MKQSDFENFSGLLSQVLGFYNQTVSKFALQVWWEACQRYDLGQVSKAMTAHAMDPDRGHFAPRPADIVRKLDGSAADRSLIAWGKVFDAMQRVGAYTSVCFDDGAIHSAISDMGGWAKICRSGMDELQFVQKRFCEAHRVYSSRPDAEHPAKLIGEHEIANFAAGQKTQPPVLIGDPAKARRVLEIGTTTGKTEITALRLVDPSRAAAGIKRIEGAA